MKSRPRRHPRSVPAVFIEPADGHPITTEQLAAQPFFSQFSEAHLGFIRAAVEISYHPSGTLILDPDRAEEPFFVILSGRAAVECTLGNQVVSVEEIGTGDAVGFPWLFTPESLRFTVRVVEPATTISLPVALMREDRELEPGLGYEITIHSARAMMKRLDAVFQVLALSRGESNYPETKAEEAPLIV